MNKARTRAMLRLTCNSNPLRRRAPQQGMSAFLMLVGLVLGDMTEAQVMSAEQIKLDPDYIWGEGRSKTLAEAKDMALDALVSRIGISVVSTTTDSQREMGSASSVEWYDEFVSVLRSVSSIYLKGLNYSNQKKWRSWQSLAFVHRDSVTASFNLRKNRIRGFFQTGVGAVEEGRLGEALRNYYWGYLLARVYPDTIRLLPGESKVSMYADVTLINLVKSVFEDVDISTGECYKDGFAVMVPLRFAFRGKDISEMHFSYYSGMGTDYAVVEDGVADIPIYDQPTSPTRKLTLSVEFAYENEMGMDEEIATLHKFFGDGRLRNLKTVTLRFPWIGRSGDDTGGVGAKTATSAATEAMEVLNTRREPGEFLEVLGQYRKLGFLSFGRRDDFGDGRGCYVAIADDKKIVEILFYDGTVYRGFGSDKIYPDLSPYFKGKRQIWIKENR